MKLFALKLFLLLKLITGFEIEVFDYTGFFDGGGLNHCICIYILASSLSLPVIENQKYISMGGLVERPEGDRKSVLGEKDLPYRMLSGIPPK